MAMSLDMRKIAAIVILFQLYLLWSFTFSFFFHNAPPFSHLAAWTSLTHQPEVYVSPLTHPKLSPEARRAVAQVVAKHKFVNIQFLSLHFVKFTLSWICNVQRLDGDVLDHTVFFATDGASKAALLRFNGSLRVVTQRYPQAHTLSYGQESYFALMLWRTEILMELMESNTSFMLTEADALWLENPFEQMRLPHVPHDIIVMDDRMSRNNRRKMPNGGFIFFRATLRTRLAWREVLQQQREEMRVFALKKQGVKKHFRNEQVFEAQVFKRRAKQRKLILHWLPLEHYYSGMFYTIDGFDLTKRGHEPFVILNNFAPTAQIKVMRAVQHNHWFTQERNGTVSCIFRPPRLVRLPKVASTCRPEDSERIAVMDPVPPFSAVEMERQTGIVSAETWQVVRRLAAKRGFVNVLFVHAREIQAAKTWICNARSLEGVLKVTLFVATDAAVHRVLTALDRSLFMVYEPYSIVLEGKQVDVSNQWKYTRWRWLVLKEMLDRHVSVLYSEVTSLWIKNPMVEIGIPRTVYDVLFLDVMSRKLPSWKVPSATFMFLKSKDSTRRAWDILLKEQAVQQSSLPGWNQRLLKSVFERLAPAGNVSFCWLPRSRYLASTPEILRKLSFNKKQNIVVVHNVVHEANVSVVLAHEPGYWVSSDERCVKSSMLAARRTAGAV